MGGTYTHLGILWVYIWQFGQDLLRLDELWAFGLLVTCLHLFRSGET